MNTYIYIHSRCCNTVETFSLCEEVKEWLVLVIYTIISDLASRREIWSVSNLSCRLVSGSDRKYWPAFRWAAPSVIFYTIYCTSLYLEVQRNAKKIRKKSTQLQDKCQPSMFLHVAVCCYV